MITEREKPWIPEARLKLINERWELLKVESFLTAQLKSVRERVNQLNLAIADSYGQPITDLVNQGVDRAIMGNEDMGLRKNGEPK